MEDKEIISLSLTEGFSRAEITSTDKIVFNPAFRPYCEENLCGQYGINYSCPPVCGTPEEMERRVLLHARALVLQTKWQVDDLSNSECFKKIRLSHNSAMFRVIKNLRTHGHNGFMIGASGCVLCSPCLMKSGEECRYPDLRYSCMSAYCIHVKKLAEVCRMEYDYKDGILPFFGMYVFD